MPLILEENKKIKIERKTLFSILNKNSNSQEERNWLKSKFKQYGVVNSDLATLKIRMDEIPVSLAIAQAAKETGWGTSRFLFDSTSLPSNTLLKFIFELFKTILFLLKTFLVKFETKGVT